MSERNQDQLKIALAQMAPVWLDRTATCEKIIQYMERAAAQNCDLVTFGEALLPGYPFWIERTDGARFNDAHQKIIHAHYLEQAVQIEAGHLDPICACAAAHNLSVYLGIIERPRDRGGHSAYASLVFIDGLGKIKSVHRKLMPTYEERLAWAPGDGYGLVTHCLGAFTLGGLNCWENWMPMPRAALYAQGEDLHVSVWPGGLHNTKDLPLFLAKEGRSYVIAVSGLMRVEDIPLDTPLRDQIIAGHRGNFMANGASALAGPDGEWIIEPQIGEEGLYTAVVDHSKVLEERQNFDPAGHYSRPDVMQLHVNCERQSTVKFVCE